MTGLGLNGGKIAFGKESIYGTAVARTNVFCMNSDGLAVTEEEIENNCLHGDFQKAVEMYKGNIAAGGDFEFDVRYEGLELFLENLLGTKTTTETAAYEITAANKFIDFKEDGGGELNATIAESTYILGETSADAGSLCEAIKTALEAAGTGTYTVTYDRTTKLFDIAVAGIISAVLLMWLTGTNTLVSVGTTLGYDITADSSSAANVTADDTIESVYTHVFTRSVATSGQQIGLTMEALVDDLLTTGKSKLYNGCMLGSMDFNVVAGELITGSMNIIAKDEELLDTETVSGITYEPKPIALAKQAAITYGGASEALVNTFSATLGMNLKDDRYHIGDNTRGKPVPNDRIEITGTMEIEFEDRDKYDDFRNNTTKAIVLTITGDDFVVGAVPYSISFNFPTIKMIGASPQVSDRGLIVVETGFKAGGVDVNNKGVEITLVNSIYLA